VENQVDYYAETGKYRDRFDRALPVMAAPILLSANRCIRTAL